MGNGLSYFEDTPSAMLSGTNSLPVTDYIMNMFGQNSAAQQNRYNAEQAALTRNFNAAQAALTRDFNSSEAEKQRRFEERMSNTAYQRAIADMNAAGLNTALAYSQGGAAVPHAASASASGASSGSASSANGGSALSGLLGGVIGSITSLAKTAIQANSASAVADQYADSRRDVAAINAATRKDVADKFVKSRRENRPDIQDVTYYRDKFGDYHKYTQHLYRD